MKSKMIESYKGSTWPLRYHGGRTVNVLKESLRDVDEALESDIYGNGEVIESFQDKMADLLGKASAVFFPSGTMCQQIALRIWCDRTETVKVGYHPLCHLEIHEHHGLRELHGIQGHFLCDRDCIPTLEDIKALPEDVKVVLLELPQREIGGQLPAFSELVAISDHCRAKGIRLHMDGARLLECCPYYGKTAKELADLFDSVYISFYKGINGIAGAVLAGDKDFTEESKIWKRRHGGDLISLYPYILAADYNYELRKNAFQDYYEGARLLAYRLNRCKGVHTVPKIPVSNMFHVYFDGSPEAVASVLERATEASGVGLCPSILIKEDGRVWFEMAVGDLLASAPEDRLDVFMKALNKGMEGISDGTGDI